MHRLLHVRVPLACLPANFRSEKFVPLEPWHEVDITVEKDRILSVTTTGTQPIDLGAASATDLNGTLVFPGLLDCHTHLDKCHTWDRAPNPRGEFWDALAILHADSVNWTEADVYRRASFALRRAWAHGTVAIRTHLDSGPTVGEAAHAAIGRLRDEWSDRVELQTIPLFPLAHFAGAEMTRLVNFAARHHSSALGGFPQPNPDLAKQLDSLLSAARELGIGLDLHVDESALKQAECLRAIAEAVLRHEFPYPVTCGHCCSLALHADERRRSTIDLVRAARINIVSLPLCNLYLQGRRRSSVGSSETPRWRGLTTLHEFLDAGVTVACASDNVRDAFYAWGDLDAVEVFGASVRIGHLDTRLEAASGLVTSAAAQIMGSEKLGLIRPGTRAEFVIFDARTFNELLSSPNPSRRFFRRETFEERRLPSYAELG